MAFFQFNIFIGDIKCGQEQSGKFIARRLIRMLLLDSGHLFDQIICNLSGMGHIGFRLKRIRLTKKLYRYKLLQ